MKLIACLSFYDEKPEHLERLIASLPAVGVTHLAALDGAYKLYPGGQPRSAAPQHAAIRRACRTADIRLHLRAPDSVWRDNEIEKRTALFALATRYTTLDDWLLIMDADEEITRPPDQDLKVQLADAMFDAAEVTYIEDGRRIPFPKLFRAIPGLHCLANHYTYRTPDGRNLWGNACSMRLEARLPIHDMHVRHHNTGQRTAQRDKARHRYYTIRDQRQVEVHHLNGVA